ncbi:MAG: InlB B-repeat-containing protein [Lachnospiraceae bacterium]|nr:InlB B-repeat-containing protein [Lachnospiraceae bacterium]
MKSESRINNMISRKTVGILLAILLLCILTPVVYAANNKATTIRLAKTEGQVTVQNSEKGELIQTENMRLYSGDHELTGAASYAWMNLDDAKAIKLDELSETELRKKWRKLEVMLDSGSVFFNVTVPLEDDEALNIRSSTMVTGIRGTCGWVRILDGETTRVYLLEGELECVVTNPVEGSTKTITLKPGEYADFCVYDPDEAVGDTCEIIPHRFDREDIEPYVLVELLGDMPLINKIYDQSGIDLRNLTSQEVSEALAQKQAENLRKFQAVQLEANAQDAVISKDPVWSPVAKIADGQQVAQNGENGQGEEPGQAEEDRPKTRDDIPFKTPNSITTVTTPTTPPQMSVNEKTQENDAEDEEEDEADNTGEDTPAAEETPVTDDTIIYLTMPQTATTVQGYLDQEKVKQVVLLPGTGSVDDNTLKVDIDFNTPVDKTLTARAAVPVNVLSGNSFTVNGTADLQDTLTNNGTVTVVSANTLRVVKRFLNHGILDNTETGRIVLSAGLSSDGAFLTAGLVEAAEGVTGDALITIDGGSFTITAGKIVSDQFDTIIEIQSGASVTLNLSGGSVSNDKEGGATLEVSTGDFHIAALGTDIMGITDNLLGADTDLAQYEAASVWLKDERYHLVALASVDSYPVVVSGDIEHGTIEVPARVEAGASVPLTITPDDGYELETVTVNLYDTDGGIGAAVAVAEDYTFEMPRSNVIVGGSFKKIIVAHDVTVIKTDATQGAVISSTPAAKPGETVTLTITPEAGYEIDTVTVTDADGNVVELTQTENGYSFVMPEGEVKVNTTFRKLKYTITWTNEDGTTMETDADVEYGDMPVYNGETPMKPATAQYTYTFTGWTQTVEAATKDVTYVAAFAETLNTYAVTWKDEDGTVLRTDPAVAYGTAPVYGGEAAPGKAGMAQYSYTFAGWQSGDSLYAADQALPAVTGAVSYTAVYTQTVNRYAVTFVDEDGETVLQAAALYDYGTKADQVAQPKAPAKTADAQYTYAFAGWRLGDILYTGDAVLPDVTEDMTYTAVYHTTLNTYTVTWKNEDGTVLETDTDVAYGSVPSYDGETPAKTADAQYSYTFLGWTPAITNVTGNVTYVATYTNTTKAYTVTWKNEDGTVLETDEAVRYGETPSYDGATPTKTADAQYTYTFAAWTPEVNPVTGNVTYTASYASEVNKYNITFVDEDGETVLKAALGYEYGTKSAKIAQPATPVKAATAQYSYTFAGWKVNDTIYAAGGALPDVTEDVVYRAVYDSSVNTYTVIWKHEDGMVLETDEDVAYGDTPAYNGSTPVKTATKQYSYTFSGWSVGEAQYTGDAVLPVVTGNVTYTTVFDSAVNQYTVTFVDEDGVTVLKPAVSYDYGTKSAEIIQPDTPKKTATAQYTYTFVGWEQGETTYAAGAAGVALPDVTENVVYRAVYDSSVNTYIVTWKNADGTVLETDENVAYGEAPAYDGDTPVQTSTAQYTYTFAGWKLDSTIYGGDTAMPAVTGNVTYTAAYDSTVNTYTVTWKNADGTVLEIDENVPYGSTPSYDGATPAKDADAQYTYTFLGWDTAITNVISDVTYVATYTNITNAYKVIWQNEDGTVLETDRDVLYGATPVYNGETPTKAATAQYTYTFAAWTPEVNPVTGNVTYTASYTSEVNQYNITFVDEDGSTVLKAAATYDYGTESAKIAQPATPVKTATAQYTYTFAGWKVNDTTYAVGQALPDVTANAVYQATYSAATNAYTVTWKNADGTVLKTDLNVLYGTVPSYEGTTPVKPADAQYTYTFAGWSAAGTDHAAGEALPSVTGDVTFTAAFSNTVNQYSVTFVDEDGTTVLKAAVGYDYGTAAADIVKPADPTKATDARYTYKFSGWTPEITDVTTDAVYKATYSSTVNQYNVTFVDEDGKTILKAAVGYDYGTAAADIVKPTDPAKEADAQYTYKFAGWSPALAEVTGAAVYTATYSRTVNTYPVTWKNDNGDVLETDEDVPYNSVPSYDGATPVKEADAQYTYTFLGWDTAITNVTGNITYTATYTNTTNAYTVTWKDEDGSVLETDENVLYGETPTYDGATPTKEATAQYTYTFAAWTPSVNTVTGDVTYTASYTSEVNQYNVTFVDEDGRTVLKAATAYDYGTAAADIVKPADPTKDSTEQYTYKFSGWTPAVAEVTGAASYTATYTAVPRTYAVTLNLNAGADTSAAINAGSVTEYTYGTGATLPTDVTRTGYTFDGWYTTADSTDSGTKVTAIGSGETGDKTFYARWKINTYNVIWKNADIDNTTLRTDSDVEYGTVPSYGAATDPAKTATAQYTYTFSGWTDGTANYAVGAALPAVTADVTYTAVYTPVLREYTITFYGDGADLPLHTQDVKYGETPVYNGTTPVKASTVSTDYTFAGWQNESGDAT